MGTNEVNKGSKIGRATIIYYPGTDIYNIPAYKVRFLSDMTIGGIKYSSTSVPLHNAWRPQEEETDQEDDIDWTRSQEKPSKKQRHERKDA